MRRPALYSSARRPSGADGAAAGAHPAKSSDQTAAAITASGLPPTAALTNAPGRRRFAALQSLALLWSAVGLLALLLAVSLFLNMRTGGYKLTQDAINAAVLRTLETTELPSPAVKAYEAIIPSVVRVVALGKSTKGKDGIAQFDRSVGTGVVVVDKGIILTNLHVVQDAETIKIIFSDGLETTAIITGMQPENDLAVLQARTIPDDLTAATLRSTTDLAPGDLVMAVGYPFGIGPSASSGIISGLGRTFRSPEGRQPIKNLIQFDAAANPGNSGGPLVTMDGHVIGIVTAIYNPNQQGSFVGIGFAVPIENAAAAAGQPPF